MTARVNTYEGTVTVCRIVLVLIAMKVFRGPVNKKRNGNGSIDQNRAV